MKADPIRGGKKLYDCMMKKLCVSASLAAISLISALGLAQEAVSWRRIRIPGIPFSFSAEMPFGTDVHSIDVTVRDERSGGLSPGRQFTLDSYQPGQEMENLIRIQLMDRFHSYQTGFEYYTNQSYENRGLLKAGWGAPETKRWKGFLVHEIGEKLGPSSDFPKMRRNIYYIVEMGPLRWLAVELSCYDADLPRYAPVYMRIRDSLKPASSAPRQ